MAADLRSLIDDLEAESAVLQDMLAELAPAQWGLATPAPGWSIGDQVGHLAYFDGTTLLSITDPPAFRAASATLTAGGDDFPDRIAADHRHLSSEQLSKWFTASRTALLQGYRDADPTTRLPWYGVEMGVASSVTARLMETWAHGQDIADTAGVVRTPTGRLRHIAHLGIRSLPYSYRVNSVTIPDAPVRIELIGPDGDRWEWGPADADNRVSGTALDFCLLVTQRRHRHDTDLQVSGAVAQQWTSIAQAFAGAAGSGRPSVSQVGAKA